MIFVPSKYLVRIPLKINKKPYFIIYHSLLGSALRITGDVWNLIKKFSDGIDFPRSFNKKEVSTYRETVLELKKRHFLVKKGKNERSLLNNLWLVDEKRLIAGSYITTLILEMASYCNFRCAHCFAPKIYAWKKGAKMSFHTAKLAVDGFINILKTNKRKKGYIRFWGGEPLLNWEVIKQVVEYVEKVTRKSPLRIFPLIITNASLLDDQKLNFIKRHKIKVRFSLDGLEKDNDRFRKFIDGEGTFKSIIKAMEGLSKYGIEFSIEFCLNDYNFYSIEKFLDFVFTRYKKCKGVVISPILYKKSIPNFDHHSNQEKAERLVEIYRYAREKGYAVNPADGLALAKMAIKQQGFVAYNCAGLQSYLYVNPLGSVYPCHQILTILGTVKQMKKIPQKRNYKYVALRRVRKIKGCEGCEIEGFCSGGCAGVTQFYSGDIYDTSNSLFRSFYCDFYRHLFRELLKYCVYSKFKRKNK